MVKYEYDVTTRTTRTECGECLKTALAEAENKLKERWVSSVCITRLEVGQ